MSHIDFSGPSGVSRPSARSSQPGRSAGADLGHLDPRPSPARLRGISDRELLSRVKDLVSRERAVTLEILVHLNEVERRRLHLGLGYPSMFEYAIQHLGYSHSAAARRIRAARCVRDHPEVYGLLERNEVTLITISLVAPILDESNAKDLISKIREKSQREVEAIVATYRPPVSMRDRAKPVCVAVPAPSGPQLNGPRGAASASAGSEKRPNAAASSAGGPPQGSTDLQALRRASTQPSEYLSPCPAIGDTLAATSGAEGGTSSPSAPMERKFLVQFLASPGFMQKFERVKALLSNKNGTPSYEAVLESALDEFLKDHDPEQRKQRREERGQKTKAKTKTRDRAAKRNVRSQSARRICEAGCGQVDGPLFRRRAGDLSGTRVLAEGASRRIPAAVRDAVFARDKGRCTYVGSTGQRCDTTQNLQIDHIVPYARGGTRAVDNLRLLCERHNKHEAERVLGANTVRRFRRRE
jgi:5-methylcytosine-specific restriction endonuclease McrA